MCHETSPCLSHSQRFFLNFNDASKILNRRTQHDSKKSKSKFERSSKIVKIFPKIESYLNIIIIKNK